MVRLLNVICLTPKNPKICDPVLVTLLKMRPHYSQSSRENATPSSGTFPLASYKEVAPPGAIHRITQYPLDSAIGFPNTYPFIG